jgi:hypothetical protein
MSTNEISNTDDVIDSRDVIERIAALESASTFLDADQIAELNALQALAEQGEDCGDWKHGETLIRETYFQEWAQDFAEDIGAVERDVKWPYTCIDWEHAARELKYDYTTIDFDGVDYLIRS